MNFSLLASCHENGLGKSYCHHIDHLNQSLLLSFIICWETVPVKFCGIIHFYQFILNSLIIITRTHTLPALAIVDSNKNKKKQKQKKQTKSKQNKNKYKNTNLMSVAYSPNKFFLLAGLLQNGSVFCWMVTGAKSNLLPMKNGNRNPKIFYIWVNGRKTIANTNGENK